MSRFFNVNRWLVLGLALLLPAGAVHAATLETLVLNGLSGPVYAPSYYNVKIGSTTYNPGSIPPNLSNTSFSLNGVQYPTYPTGDTQVLDTLDNACYGKFNVNIDTAHPSNDFLTEQIDFGSGNSHPSGLVTLFNSTTLLGFGSVAGTPGEYWFAFQETTATSYASVGEIVGGIMQPGYTFDVKTAAFMAPTPSAAVSGAVLMLGYAGFCLKRRLAPAAA